MTINARKPMAAFFGHFLPGYLGNHNKKRAETDGCHFQPISAIFYLTAIFAIFRPLSAWLPRCSWCLTRGNRWLLFCMKSFMTLFFRPFFCHFCRVFYSLFFRPFSVISTRPPFSYIYFYFEQLASNAMAGLRPNP